MQARSQAFACLNKLSTSHELLQPVEKIKLKILEHCVEAAGADLKETTSGGEFIKIQVFIREQTLTLNF